MRQQYGAPPQKAPGTPEDAGERGNPQILAGRAAPHVTLDDPYEFAVLLEMVQGVGADAQVSALLTRDPAAHVPLQDPLGVGKLLGMLRATEAFQQASALLARDPPPTWHLTHTPPVTLARSINQHPEMQMVRATASEPGAASRRQSSQIKAAAQ